MSILFGLLSLVPVLRFSRRGDSWGSTRRGRGEAKRNTSTTTALERYVYTLWWLWLVTDGTKVTDWSAVYKGSVWACNIYTYLYRQTHDLVGFDRRENTDVMLCQRAVFIKAAYLGEIVDRPRCTASLFLECFINA